MLRHTPPIEKNGLNAGLTSPLNKTATSNNNNNSSNNHRLTHAHNSPPQCHLGVESPLNSLQKQFVLSMKTLFDILDHQRTGFIKFSDIEKGWQDDTCKGLPRGVLDSLRKVTPGCGLLSFERFCAGLKLCLLRQPKESVQINDYDFGENFAAPLLLKGGSKSATAPKLEIENPIPHTHWSAAAKPLHLHSQRALSMPQLSPDSELDVEATQNTHCHNVYIGSTVAPPTAPPPKPPRASMLAANNNLNLNHNNNNAVANKAEIRHALQNWQMNALLNEMDAKAQQRKAALLTVPLPYRGCADGGSSSATDSPNANSAVPQLNAAKKSSGKRREARRHTLQNGIDYNMLRRMKQLEEEQEVLLLALHAVEKARDWYMQQVNNVQEKIKYLGRLGTVSAYGEQWSEAQQERLNLQRARVLEVNRNLAVLLDSWEHGTFPTHLNLAINSSIPRRNAGAGVGRNVAALVNPLSAHISNELQLSSAARIATLEREKQKLLRELYELQQRAGLAARSRAGFLSVLSQSSPVCSSSSGGLGDADVVY